MTIQEIQIRKDGQTFDCKSIQIEPKALAIPIVAFANEVNGTMAPIFRTDDFILKITVAKLTEKTNRVTENTDKVTEEVINTGETLTENRLDIL